MNPQSENEEVVSQICMSVEAGEYARLRLIVVHSQRLVNAVTRRMSGGPDVDGAVWEMFQAHKELSDTLKEPQEPSPFKRGLKR